MSGNTTASRCIVCGASFEAKDAEIAQLRAELALLKSERDAAGNPCPSCAGDAGYESGGPEGWIADECTCHPLRQENERLKADLQVVAFERDDAVAKCAVHRDALIAVSEWADQIAGDERVCSWVHSEDYGLYCLLADPPIDFESVLANPDPLAQALLRDRERWKFIRKYLEMDDVGDDRYILGLVVAYEQLCEDVNIIGGGTTVEECIDAAIAAGADHE